MYFAELVVPNAARKPTSKAQKISVMATLKEP